MKKLFRKLFKKFVVQIILDEMDDKRDKIITHLNLIIDIPKIDEEKEKKILQECYNAVINTTKLLLLEKI